MSELTKPIFRNNDTDPCPQYYNASTDAYEVQKGSNGNSFVAIKSIDANNGVDIGDVTINNAAGANAVNIQDGGNSITVDGTVAATQSGTWNVTNISGTVSLPTGASTEATLASVKTSVELIDDTVYTNGSGTPSKAVAIAGSDGTNPRIIKTDANGELQVDVLTLPSLPAGSAILGKTGIDQTTDGTTNRVVAKISQVTGENAVVVSSVPSAGWTISQDSGANAINTLTKSNSVGQKHYITSIEVVVSGAAVGASDVNILLKDASTTKWKQVIPASAVRGTRVYMNFSFPIQMSTNSTCTLTIDAGGSSVVTTGNMAGYTM